MSMNGKCLCGKVKLEAEDVETHFHACHCGMCRRWSGGSPFFGADAKSVKFDDPGGHVTRFQSSDWAERGFCNQCGTTLFYFLKPASRYAISIGLFDDQKPFELSGEIYIDHKPSAYAFTGDHPRKTEEQVLAEFAKQSG